MATATSTRRRLFAAYTGATPALVRADDVRALLLESGLWTALRTRPFSRVPAPQVFAARALHHGHGHAPACARGGRGAGRPRADFEAGVTCLAKLTSGPTFVCVGANSSVTAPSAAGVKLEVFDGPHPAGTAGTHIHLLSPVDLERSVWHIGYQDVAAVGRLFSTGRLDVERVISLAGPSVQRPRLLRTRLGASIDDLVRARSRPVLQRTVISARCSTAARRRARCWATSAATTCRSGAGRSAERELFGWIMPGFDKFSIWGVVAGAFTGRAHRSPPPPMAAAARWCRSARSSG